MRWARQLAKGAKLDPSAVNRMEGAGAKPVRGHADNVERVVDVLRRAGVEFVHEPTRGVRLIRKDKR